MKTNALIALLLALCLLLTACAPAPGSSTSAVEPPPAPPAASACSPGRPHVDLEDKETLYQTFLRALTISGLAARDWENPMDLEPDQLVVYGLIELDGQGFSFPQEGIPGDALEAQVLDRFQVTADHLRRSSYYNSQTSHYLTEGYGGAARVEVVEATQEGNLLTLAYDVFVGKDKLAWGGESVVELTQDGYRYRSNRRWDGPNQPKLSSARFWQETGETTTWELAVDDPALLVEIQKMSTPTGMRWLSETPRFPDGGGPLHFSIIWEDGKETIGASWARYPEDGYCTFSLEPEGQDVQYYAQPERRALELIRLLEEQGVTVTG